MAAALAQDKKVASLKTELGEDVLAVTRFDGREGLSELFTFEIEAVSDQGNINFDKALGKNAAVTVTAQDGLKRVFNGVVVEARWVGTIDDLHAYRLVLRPWLWLLGHTSDCRIFSSKRAPEIIEEIFAKNGFSGSARNRLSATYPKMEYCVQYRESDLNFVCRLMEEFGIYYYFDHSAGGHTLVLADAKSSHDKVPGLSALDFMPIQVEARRDKQLVRDWTSHRAFQSGRFVLNEYNYLQPNANMIGESAGGGKYEHGSMEIYDYPGRYENQPDGVDLAKVRLEADQARDGRRLGSGSAVSLFPGGLVSLDRHTTPAENQEYMIVSCTHSVGGQMYRSGTTSGTEYYSGVYEFLPSSKPFRAPQVTPKALVHGPQTAKVVGTDEIDVDEHGRIIVQFYWDRKKKESRRVRVAQVWSGKGWGGIVIPRVGQEVVVQFLEGDPDQPLVVGTVYNAENTVPYALPANKTISGVKSKTHKGGGYNEIIMEDKNGSELIRAHAQKDLEVKVLNDERRVVDKAQSEKIGTTQTLKVGTSQTVDVGTSSDVTIGTTYTLTATAMIELKCGTSSIKIGPSGITMVAPMIMLN